MTQDPRFTVLVNIEDQYATVPVTWPVPDGWRPADFVGTADDCADYVDQHWTDMRPASLRAWMADRLLEGNPHGETP